MARDRYRTHDGEAPHFLTATIVNWMPLFSQRRYAQIVVDAMSFAVREDRWTLYAYVIMEHHLHWIAQAPDLVTQVRRFKSYIARRIIDDLEQQKWKWALSQLAYYKKQYKHDQHFQLWQEGNHPKQIVGREMLLQKIRYIHENPVRRGYVDVPEHWRYSSARDYQNEQGLVPVTRVRW